MGKVIDLIGQKFGKLVVTERMDNNKWKHLCWLCQCDCGRKTVVTGNHLKSGETRSCGCLKIKHGHNKNSIEKTKIYRAWNNMIQRCTNSNYSEYERYGGRGIMVCGEWLQFSNFLKDMGESPGHRYSIDRINNNKGYYKKNCRWATPKEQARNTSRNRLVTCFGRTQCLTAWAEEINIDWRTLQKRLNLGWPTIRALTVVKKGKQNDKKRTARFAKKN